ncbi:MAG: DNA replication/repair protein RecF [bacterium]|nr:DNA replication/repair protein RecF [bacterium]
MHIRKITLSNFRNFADFALEVESGPVYVVGDNGAGKTNIVEAIHLLGLCRSFRTSRVRDTVRLEQTRATVRADVASAEGEQYFLVDYERKGERNWYINGNHIPRLTDYIGNLPVVSFVPDDLAIVKGEPGLRRRFLDVWLGQVNREYLYLLKRYQEVLKQRNFFLNTYRYEAFNRPEMEALDEMLVQNGASIVEMRTGYLAELAEIAARTYDGITGDGEHLRLEYKPSFEPGKDSAAAFHAALVTRRNEEKRRLVSLVGPHRDDFAIYLDEKDGRRYASQGQQRSAALALRLAQYEFMRELGETPLLLLDDVASELDDGRRRHLRELIEGAEQVWVTAARLPDGADGTVVRIEEGRVLDVEI